jgi:uncharacterized protein YcfJ
MKLIWKGKVMAAGLSAALLLSMAPHALAQSSAYCDSYARDYANRHARAGENVVGGAVAGAIGGALLGGIIGGKDKAGKGALIGAGVGTAAGAVNSSAHWQDHYHYAFDRCMSSRTNARRLVPGSEEWYEYCEAKYRSFDPDTGMYLANSGRWRPCR